MKYIIRHPLRVRHHAVDPIKGEMLRAVGLMKGDRLHAVGLTKGDGLHAVDFMQ